MEEFILQIFVVCFILFWISVYKLSNLIPDIRSNKLDIRKDIFLSLTQEQYSYMVEFKEEGNLKLFVLGMFKLKEQDEVFIIRTSVSKKILEVVSVNAIEQLVDPIELDDIMCPFSTSIHRHMPF